MVWEGAHQVFAPVVYDLRVGYPFLNGLNSASNISREAGAISQRVGLYTAISPQNGFFRLAFKNVNEWGNAREATIAVYMTLFDHYSTSYDFNLWANRHLWFDGALALVDFDAHWYDLIGSLDYYYRITDSESGFYYTELSIYANDGLVDHRSAAYPNATLIRNVTGDIAHRQQTTSLPVAERLQDVLQNVFGIPLRQAAPPPPPPPPTYSVIIHGPTQAQPGNTCCWYVATSVPDPLYEWSAGRTALGSDRELWYSPTSSFTLTVRVWNASGAGGSASTSVSVSSANARCEAH
jgi:hypothetical protein